LEQIENPLHKKKTHNTKENSQAERLDNEEKASKNKSKTKQKGDKGAKKLLKSYIRKGQFLATSNDVTFSKS